MKIAVVGGGSTYTPELVHGLAARAGALGLTELALCDADAARLAVVGGFCRRLAARLAPDLILSMRPLAEALGGARFVLMQIRVGGQAARLADERLGLEYAVVGQETTGLGGLAKALRTVPAVLDIAAQARALAPEATLINFTNPVSIVTEALLGKGARVIGLCNIPISQRMELAQHLQVPPEAVELDSVGLNHLSFVRGVRVQGREVLPELLTTLAAELARGRRPANIPDLPFPPELLLALGMLPSDYLRYYYLTADACREQREAKQQRAEVVMEVERELLAHYADPTADERPASLSKRGGAHYSTAAVEIITAASGSTPTRLIADVENGQAVRELPPRAAVELPALVSRGGVSPLAQAPLPPVIRGLIQHVKSYEELAVRAAESRDPRDVMQALLAHPLAPSARHLGALAARLLAR